MELHWPSEARLPSYVAVLQRGWSPDSVDPAAAQRELEAIRADAARFLRGLVDPEPGGTVTLPDGSLAERIPGYRKWMWDGEFCGSISFRWQAGTEQLPVHVLGHIGYSVVPWKRRRGYATAALRETLLDAAATGLRFVEVTTDVDNLASQRVVIANGGELIEQFLKAPSHGGAASLRYRIALSPTTR